LQRKHLTAQAVLIAAAAAANLAQAAPSAGQAYFENNCASCHTVDPSLASRTGPGLYGVVGRKLGALAGFNYTDAMARAGAGGKTWTKAELDLFLSDPDKAIPGTSMPVLVADKPDRDAVIDYLATLSGKAAGAGESKAAATATASDAATWTENKPGKLYRINANDLPPAFASSSAGNSPKLAQRPEGAMPSVPPGFKIGIFAKDTDKGRNPLRAPNGDIFVVEPGKGEIKVFRSGGAEAAEASSVFATGLTRPYGMAFYPSGAHPKYLYVANVNSVVRYPYAVGDLRARGEPETVVAQLVETTGGHVTRTLAFSVDDKTMFVSIGSATNVASDIGAKPPEPLAQWETAHGVGGAWGVETDRAAVLAFSPDGRGRHAYATGLRNCVGMLVYPGSGDLMCSVNERDELGDNLPPDYIV
jgi:glucose/arabinose dehydrogenase